MAEQREIRPEEIGRDLPAKVVELLARPQLTDLPENPVGRVLEELRSVFADFVPSELPEVVDSLVVHLEDPAGGNGELLLYVQLRDGAELDDALRRRIATALRTELSPRHIPDGIAELPQPVDHCARVG